MESSEATRKMRELVAETSPGVMPFGASDLIHHGSMTWDMWQNHVPLEVAYLWPELSEETRLAVYLTAKAVTFYRDKTI